MKLFRYEGYQLVISEEAMLLKPFKALWKRDKTRDKSMAQMELGYIYFMEDPRSDYMMFIDRDERDKQIRKGEGIKDSWKPDAAVKEAMAFYSNFKTDAALLLEKTRRNVKKIEDILDSIDVNEAEDPLVALDKLVNITSKLPKLSLDIAEAEKKMVAEITQSDNVRGNQEKSMFEDD